MFACGDDGSAGRAPAACPPPDTPLGSDGKERERRLSVAEADAYLAEVAALHDRSARKDAELAQRRAEAQEQRAELAATIDLRCRHCDTPPRYAGRRNLVSLGAPEHVAREDLAQLARPETSAYEEYVCPTCGAVELFRAGALEHPLPGTAA